MVLPKQDAIRSLIVSDPSPFILRTYRHSKKWQWLREAIVNSIEADAKRIEIAVEPEGIDLGIYRYVIYDNGFGIGENEFDKFIMTYGGGGKPIGEACENFGIGLKACLLPWNKYGLVVVSVKDGCASMVWLQGNDVTENSKVVTKFGARIWDVEDPDNPGMSSTTTVIQPFKTAGIDFEKTIPDWIGVKKDDDLWYGPDGKLAHGTVLILMGNSKDEDTILGDRSRSEAMGVDGGRAFFPDHIYIEQRFWEIPKGVELTIRMPNNKDKKAWPTKREWFAGSRDVEDGKKKVTQRRTCSGAKRWIEHPYGVKVEDIPKPKHGVIDIDGPIPAKAYWYLRNEKFPREHWHKGESLGYIAALYDNELYDRMESKITGILNKYNRFGIYHGDVQRNLFLIFEPQVMDQRVNKHDLGAYPIDSRSHLQCNSTEGAGLELPWDEWAIDFKRKMPDAIKEAERKLDADVSAGDLSMSEECKRRVAKYGDRYLILRPFVGPKGDLRDLEIANINRVKAILDPRKGTTHGPAVEEGTRPRKARKATYVPGIEDAGTKRGLMMKTRTNLPEPIWKKSGDFEAGWNFSRWEQEKNQVWINEDHKIYLDTLEYACARYQCPREDAVKAVRLAFNTCLCTKIAHTYGMKAILSSDNMTTDEIMEKMLSPESLTTAALGFHDIENDLDRQMLQKFGVKKEA